MSIHCLSFAGQFTYLSCSWFPDLSQVLPFLVCLLTNFLVWLLIGHSSLPEFVSFDTTYSPSCYSTFSDNFLFSNSSLEFTTWRGSLSVLSVATALFDSAPSVLTTSILDLLQFLFQLQIQFLALLTCPLSIPGVALDLAPSN